MKCFALRSAYTRLAMCIATLMQLTTRPAVFTYARILPRVMLNYAGE